MSCRLPVNVKSKTPIVQTNEYFHYEVINNANKIISDADQRCAECTYQIALANESAKDNYKQAMALYFRAAVSNHVEATFKLGYIYHTIHHDYNLAMEWYLKAQKLGHPNVSIYIKQLCE